MTFRLAGPQTPFPCIRPHESFFVAKNMHEKQPCDMAKRILTVNFIPFATCIGFKSLKGQMYHAIMLHPMKDNASFEGQCNLLWFEQSVTFHAVKMARYLI